MNRSSKTFFLFTLYSFLFLPIAFGSTPSADTLRIASLRVFGPYQIPRPFLSDSVNISGESYDHKKWLTRPLNPTKEREGALFHSDKSGFLTLSEVSLAKGSAVIMEAQTSLVARKYDKGEIIVESTLPFDAYLDERRIVSAEAGGLTDTVRAPFRAQVRLLPQDHSLEIHLRLDGGTLKRDTLISPRLRVSYVSNKGNAEVFSSVDGVRPVSLEFMMSGEGIGPVWSSPSGEYYLLRRTSRVLHKSESALYLYKGTIRVGRLPFHEASWLPQRDLISFTRKGPQGRELWVLDPKTLEEECLSLSIPEGRYRFLPTEDRLLFFERQPSPERSKGVDRIVDRDDRLPGYRDRYNLSLFDLSSGVLSPITYGYRSTLLSDLSPDGQRLIFSTTSPLPSRPFSTTTYCELDLSSLAVDTLFASTSEVSEVFYTSLSGQYLCVGTADAFGGVGRKLPEGMITNTYDAQLFLYDKSRGEATPLTRDFDPCIKQVRISGNAPYVYFTAEDRDYVPLYRCDLRRKRIERLSSSEDVIRTFSIPRVSNPAKSQLYYIGQSAMNSDRLYSISLSSHPKERCLMDFSAERMRGLTLGTCHDWVHTMPDGEKVQGRYYLPPNFDPAKKYPMIVYYYGGTAPTSRTFEGAYSLPMYAAQGYVVYTLNPSGTTGFGQEYAARHVNAWGKRTAQEIISAVKAFSERHAYVDQKRIGCIGASYGGFMTQYLQTQTDLFRAAVSHAGISSLASYWGEGFWGVGYSTVASADSYPWNNPELYTRQSPLFNADKITTPLLLLHGSADTNVPEGESVQMYNALKILGKEVEFVRVHGEDHFILDPSKRIGWTHTIFAWFARWLQDDSRWWEELYPKVNL